MTAKDRQRIERLEQRIKDIESNFTILLDGMNRLAAEIQRNTDERLAYLESDEVKHVVETVKSYLKEVRNVEEKKVVRH